MTTSGSANWTLTGKDVIKSALLKLRVIDPTQAIDQTTLEDSAVVLNAMIKSWQLDGVDIWLNQEIVVYMDADAEYYDLGPTGDEAAELRDSCFTQLATDEATSSTSLSVDSITGFADGDNIGIILNDDTIYWDTVDGTPSGTTITLTTGLSGGANTDNYVFGYTSAIDRPIEITGARVRNTNNDDSPLRIHTNREDFMRHTDKTSEGETQEVYYEPLLTNGRLYVWPVCGDDNITDRIILSTKRTIMDIDTVATDNFDMPNEVMNAVIWNLADELQPNYGLDYQNITMRAQGYYMLIRKVYRQKGSIYLRP
jgi:hypothetical protein